MKNKKDQQNQEKLGNDIIPDGDDKSATIKGSLSGVTSLRPFSSTHWSHKMKVGDRVTISNENLKRWPKLEGKKLIIWHIEPGFVYIKVGKIKDYHPWNKNWFI